MKSLPREGLEIPEKKKCSRCLKVKDSDDFSLFRKKEDSLQDRCKTCEREIRTQHRQDKPIMNMYSKARDRARKFDREFTIKRSDIHIPDRCPCLGIPLQVAKGQANDNSPSLDRIDNDKGYTPENIWVISNKANTIKSVASPRELELIAKAVRARLKDIDNKQMSLNI